MLQVLVFFFFNLDFPLTCRRRRLVVGRPRGTRGGGGGGGGKWKVKSFPSGTSSSLPWMEADIHSATTTTVLVCHGGEESSLAACSGHSLHFWSVYAH